MNVWIDVAVMASLFAVGNILFGHFEERTPKWRRVLKFFLFTGMIALISSTAGRGWSIGLISALLVVVLIIHGWWLPRTRHQRVHRRAERRSTTRCAAGRSDVPTDSRRGRELRRRPHDPRARVGAGAADRRRAAAGPRRRRLGGAQFRSAEAARVGGDAGGSRVPRQLRAELAGRG